VASSWTGSGRSSLARDAGLFALAGAAGLASTDLLPLALLYVGPLTAARADSVVDALPQGLRRWRWPLKFLVLGCLLWVGLPHRGQPSFLSHLPSAPAEAVLPKKY